jgi:hypothetical protein
MYGRPSPVHHLVHGERHCALAFRMVTTIRKAGIEMVMLITPPPVIEEFEMPFVTPGGQSILVGTRHTVPRAALLANTSGGAPAGAVPSGGKCAVACSASHPTARPASTPSAASCRLRLLPAAPHECQHPALHGRCAPAGQGHRRAGREHADGSGGAARVWEGLLPRQGTLHSPTTRCLRRPPACLIPSMHVGFCRDGLAPGSPRLDGGFSADALHFNTQGQKAAFNILRQAIAENFPQLKCACGRLAVDWDACSRLGRQWRVTQQPRDAGELTAAQWAACIHAVMCCPGCRCRSSALPEHWPPTPAPKQTVSRTCMDAVKWKGVIQG